VSRYQGNASWSCIHALMQDLLLVFSGLIERADGSGSAVKEIWYSGRQVVRACFRRGSFI